ncbi:DUF1036 domain-containing protein [Thiothrix winogradskyi]|uniref:DUF1036 domain-containing protein n=1 Tax=Thiothrix winogradskyi TaxID=96472 RepID=A0ABY3SX37_9GAMM|nr:DUF1036 domain-containing protein [Thiothrix winogradskyi]UJS24067.1 DUF1036 domain-containing protein [Thiothrix winogradskyi]
MNTDFLIKKRDELILDDYLKRLAFTAEGKNLLELENADLKQKLYKSAFNEKSIIADGEKKLASLRLENSDLKQKIHESTAREKATIAAKKIEIDSLRLENYNLTQELNELTELIEDNSVNYKTITIENTTSQPIKVAVIYYGIDEMWHTLYWWRYSPKEKSYILGDAHPSTNSFFYIYAVSEDGYYSWSGDDHHGYIDGSIEGFIKCDFGDEDNFQWGLTL